MKITDMNIEGYGIFREVGIADLPRGLVVVRGDNEAGKSTLLGFIRCIFFGFPRANATEPKYPPLNGGRYGGRISVMLDSGESYTIERIERTSGRAGGRLVVTMPDGEMGGDDELTRIMGGATRDLYKNIYAFGLSELQTFATLKAENIESAIYGASVGAAMMTLPDALKSLRDKLGELFKPAASTRLINSKLGELEKVREALRQARGGIEGYDQACNSLRQVEADLAALHEDMARIKCDHDKASACLQIWPKWVEFQNCENDLENLPIVEWFPENGIHTLDMELVAIANFETQIANLERQRNRLTDEIENLPVNDELLRLGMRIELLGGRQSSILDIQQNLPSLEGQKQQNEQAIKRILDSLGRNWTESRVFAIDRSMFTRETIRKWINDLNHVETEWNQEAGRLSDRQTDFKNAQNNEQAAQHDLDEFGELNSDADPALLNELKERRQQFVSVIPDLPMREQECSEAERHLEALIHQIHPDWTVEHLIRFDASIAAQQRIEQYDSELVRARQSLSNAETELRAAERSFEEAQHKEEATRHRLEALPAPPETLEVLVRKRDAVKQLRAIITACEKITAEIAHIRQRLQDKEQEFTRLAETPVGPANAESLAIVIVPGLALIVTGAIVGSLYSWTVGATLGMVGAGLLTWSILTRRSRRLQSAQHGAEDKFKDFQNTLAATIRECQARHAELSEKEAGLARKITEMTAEFGLEPSVSLDDLERLEQQYQAQIQQLELRRQLERDIAELGRASQLAGDRKSSAADSVSRNKADEETLIAQWKEHLQRIGLSPDLTPHTAGLVTSRVDTARNQLRNVEVLRERIRQMREACEHYRNLALQIPALSAAHNISDSEVLARVDTYFDRLLQLDERSRERELAFRTLGAAHEQAGRAHDALEQQKDTHEKALSRLNEVRREWAEWLTGHGLPKEFSPETVQDAFGHIERCVEQISKRDALADQIRTTRESLQEYETSVLEIFSALGGMLPTPANPVVAVSELAHTLREHQDRKVASDEKKRQLGENESARAELAADVQNALQRIQTLFISAETNTEQEFRACGKLYNQREALTKRIADLQMAMLMIVGELDASALRARLSITTDEKLRLIIETSDETLQDLTQKNDDLHKRRAELDLKINNMKTADEMARLRGDEERLLAEIRGYAVTWARYATALHLLQKARDKFESEQQPQVVLEAAGFFRQITNGRYSRLLAPMGEQKLEVVASSGANKGLESLSRGTAEQLYLSIRFGYIRHHAKNSETLPVVMDDILVNFDANRSAQAIQVILELAKTHQVLYFTCHNETIDRFKSIEPMIPIYVLDQGECVSA